MTCGGISCICPAHSQDKRQRPRQTPAHLDQLQQLAPPLLNVLILLHLDAISSACLACRAWRFKLRTPCAHTCMYDTLRAFARLQSRAHQLKQDQRTRTSLAVRCKSPRARTHMLSPKAFLSLMLLSKASDTCDLPAGEIVSASHPIQSCNHAEHQQPDMSTCAHATPTSVHTTRIPCRRPQTQTMRTHAAHAREARHRDRSARLQHLVLELSKSVLLTAQQRYVWQVTCLGHHAVDLQWF